jgi:NAD(P)-dependent dehydrogenase (short-subunit alcohol dehydrogenase family)
MSNASKTALVTGATRGIGYETVRQVAQTGVHTLLAGRDRAKAVEAALKLQCEGLPVEAIVLDVTDDASISAAVDEVAKKFGHLDIMVNNAGIMLDQPGKKVSEQAQDVWRKTFDTNVFGLIAVTQAFLPLLHKSPSARIVNVSSLLGSLTLHSQPGSPIYDFKVPAYNVSKSAVNAWTVQLAYELRDSRIKVNTIHPGYVKTDMNAGEGEIDIPAGAKTSVALALIDDAGPNGSYRYLDNVLPW